MKRNIILSLIVVPLIILSCSTSSNLNSSIDSPKEEQIDPNIDLTTHLRSFPGLIVKGQGGNARFTVRGINSFSAGTQPLIILDGAPVGSYFDVYSTVPMTVIKKIQVLKNPNDIAIYGVRGANGVIKITTRKR